MTPAPPAISPRSAHRPEPPPFARSSRAFGIAVFILGLLTSSLYAFVIYPRQHTLEPCIDLNGFGVLSRHLASGAGFTLGYGPTLRRAPLYPGLAAILLKVFGNYAPNIPDAVAYRPVLAAQCLIFAITCLLAYRLAGKLFGAPVGLVAGVLCACTPPTLRYVELN